MDLLLQASIIRRHLYEKPCYVCVGVCISVYIIPVSMFLRLIGRGDTWVKLRLRRRAGVNTAQAPSRSLATTRQPTPYRWVSMANPEAAEKQLAFRDLMWYGCITLFDWMGSMFSSEEFVFVKLSRPEFQVEPEMSPKLSIVIKNN